jgi:hypothetical protein
VAVGVVEANTTPELLVLVEREAEVLVEQTLLLERLELLTQAVVVVQVVQTHPQDQQAATAAPVL